MALKRLFLCPVSPRFSQESEDPEGTRGKTLSAGTYIYMLIVDGKVVDKKQMVLTK